MKALVTMVVATAILSLTAQAVAAAGEATEEIAHVVNEKSCEDKLDSTVTINPKLDAPFFKTTKGSYSWLNDVQDVKNPNKIEHTSDCISTHQGQHHMEFCQAVLAGDTLTLSLGGGFPAYASSLDIVVRKDQFHCYFGAVYPAPEENPLVWRITKKTLKVKSLPVAPGSRLYAWLSVEFEEGAMADGKVAKWWPYKIEGYIKPVVQKSP
jgi:hypothetical protein